MLIDFHVHTVYSGDSSITVGDLSKYLVKNDRLDGLVITDHDTVEGYAKLTRSLPWDSGKLIVPAVELSLAEGHLILLGVEENPQLEAPNIPSALDYAREHGCLIIIPHPFRATGLGELAYRVPAHAVEVVNGGSGRRENEMARRLAYLRGLTGVGGSDAHILPEVGKVLSFIPGRVEVSGLVKAIASRQIRVLGGFKFKADPA
ncbi:MAG: PHP domain-containing protein [Candidatus Bathyarchaeia archaeon]